MLPNIKENTKTNSTVCDIWYNRSVLDEALGTKAIEDRPGPSDHCCPRMMYNDTPSPFLASTLDHFRKVLCVEMGSKWRVFLNSVLSTWGKVFSLEVLLCAVSGSRQHRESVRAASKSWGTGDEVAENQRLGRAALKCLTNSASETSGGLFFCVLGLLPSCQLLVVHTQKASWRNPNHKASNKVRLIIQKPS